MRSGLETVLVRRKEKVITITILNEGREILTQESGEGQAILVYGEDYREGDRIRVETEKTEAFYWLQMDQALGRSMVYVTGAVEYEIPFGEKKWNLSSAAFEGERHIVSVRECREFEYGCYRNLSYNANDQHGITTCFPHASANVETRGESVFAAMNAIDGVIAPKSHGKWPYQSWGINRREDAKWRLEFGRSVVTDRIIVFLRADFPHDNWWTEGKVTFSDGSTMTLSFEKGGHAQEFTFPEKTVEWLEFDELKKADDPSPFPALTQFEVYGREA